MVGVNNNERIKIMEIDSSQPIIHMVTSDVTYNITLLVNRIGLSKTEEIIQEILINFK